MQQPPKPSPQSPSSPSKDKGTTIAASALMQQPPKRSPQSPSLPSKDKDTTIAASKNTNDSGNAKRRLPTPQELISHYESQGLEREEAASKVIDDLQHMLYKVVTGRGRGRKDKFMAEASRKLDTANARLAIVEMKLDSKPGFPESLAIGIASAASFRGLTAVWPHLVASAAHIWNSVRSSTAN